MPEISFPNFCNNSNFCTHVHNLLAKGYVDGHPVGYLDAQGCTKHLIYLTSQQRTFSIASTTTPVLESLKKLYGGSEVSMSDTASLAKQLAIGVLQYHATPWLESWDADHVLIASAKPTQPLLADGRLDSYVDVSIRNPQEETSILERSKTLIPNWILFRLGIMLLELAYQQPLREMQKPEDHYPNEHDTDFFTARRLRLGVSQRMGLEFAGVVGKCIQCNFGHGEDLGTKALQECYYKNVIQKLENIETKFKEMGL